MALPKKTADYWRAWYFTPEDAWEKIVAGASLLQIYTGWIYGGPWSIKQILAGLTSVSSSLGAVSFAEVSLDSDTDLNAAQPSSFILATLNFKAVTAATNSLINLSVKDLSDENTNPLIVAGPRGGASVTVTSSPVKIPEPSFSPLVLGLTVGLGFCLTWKKTSR